ncbi:MAG: sulfatase-like hydrolase/transferase [Candidatus Latescibacterota bacterium]
MNRRDFLRISGAGLGALALPGISTGAPERKNDGAKPNIIFILSDDVGLSEISSCGGDHYRTPRIDKLAETGIRFEYSYAMPLCGPSRCVALTGRYPFRTGLNSNQSQNAIHPDREVMIPAVLKKAGYVTGHSGKWGQMNFGPGEWGFDEYLVYPGSGRYWRGQTGAYTQNGKQVDLPEGTYLPDRMHDFVVDFITRHRDRPFFLHYCLSHMHGPIVPTPDSQPDSKDFYADNVAYMDKLVGKLVSALDSLKLRENTLIVFTGDNGTARFGVDRSTLNGGKRIHGQKGSMLEGGSRVPLIVSWQGATPAGKVNHDLIDFSDFFPTFAELGGAKLPEGIPIDGVSFASQIRGGNGTPREWVYVELNGKSYVRNAGWKLTNSGELFDMKNAPFDEIPVPTDTTDPQAIAGRKFLQKILDEHPAIPAVRGLKRKAVQKPGKRNRRRKAK